MATTKYEEHRLWLPPHRLRRYQTTKIFFAIIVGAIFVLWLFIQWSNLPIRLLSILLLIITIWTTAVSIMRDARRCRNRQIEINPDALVLAGPTGRIRIKLTDIAVAQWKDETHQTTGLWLYDQQHRLLAHLDQNLLADESEARSFLGWARGQIHLPFQVMWPSRCPQPHDHIQNLTDERHRTS